MVRPVTVNDIIGLERYEKMRDEFRRRIIELKQRRRVAVGDRITLVFENHDTVLFQIQEMLRAERIAVDSASIRAELPKFYGLDRATWLELDDVRVPGVFEGGRAREDKVSAVQYVRFPIAEHVARFLSAQELRVVIDHPHYRASQRLSPETRESLAADLTGPR